MERPDLSELKTGGRVVYVDPVAVQHDALVTAVWGDPKTSVPCVNIVLVSADKAMEDTYGRQITRHTSLCHRSVNTAHGQYYMMPGDTPNPIQQKFE